MIELIHGDAQHIPMAGGLAHCVVTSPPYYNKREYVGEYQARAWPAGRYAPVTGAPACIEVPEMRCAFGREDTIEAYIWHTLLVLRECWRVTRPDAVVWWNIADTSFGGGGYYPDAPSNKAGSKQSRNGSARGRSASAQDGLRSGTLIGVPERVRLSAQADGWYVRGSVVWAKLAVMPESVRGSCWERHKVAVATDPRGRERYRKGANGDKPQRDHDPSGQFAKPVTIDCPGCAECLPNGGYVLRRGAWRHTVAHEMIFQFTKSMDYWTNSEIVQNEAVEASLARLRRGRSGKHKYTDGAPGQATHTVLREWENDPDREVLATSNPRDVFVPEPSGGYGGDHYAVFPPELVEPLILSSTPMYACAQCGAGWSPVVDRSEAMPSQSNPVRPYTDGSDGERGELYRHGTGATTLHKFRVSSISGYRPSCKCGDGAGTVPGTVVDPFCGSGTVGMVARRHGLSFVGVDASGEYLTDHAVARAQGRTPDKKIAELPLFQVRQEE